MSTNWIYIGADIEKKEWCKVGKTSKGPHKRHTSSQNPNYFIYAAFNIEKGDVGEIEKKLLACLDNEYPDKRQKHISTGTKSECFEIHPYLMTEYVETLLLRYFPNSVPLDEVTGRLWVFLCEPTLLFKMLAQVGDKDVASKDEDSGLDIFEDPLPENLGMKPNNYFSGNQHPNIVHLGDGLYLDTLTGRTYHEVEEEAED